MYFLAFETSCDDTSVALFQGPKLIAMSTKAQLKEHNETQWVVPEVAARLHANAIFDVLSEVLAKGGVGLSDVEFIACTEKPGLLPSLLVGRTVAKSLGHALGKEVLWIDHIESHIFANLLEREVSDFEFPIVCLTVSWGHNELYLWKSLFELELLGQTRDDAAGEAFDKVSKAMGLSFPGGPVIARLATEYVGEYRGIFPIAMLEEDSLDFSFSGIKSSVKREIDLRVSRNGELTLDDKREIAYEFEQAVVRILTAKLFRAAKMKGVSTVLLAGWVSANDFLRSRISTEAEQYGMQFFAPVNKLYSMDNAAMVGMRAYYEWMRTHNSVWNTVKTV